MERAKLTGGFLLLVGNSSVGKTRLLYEATRSTLSDFAIVAPSLGDGRPINSMQRSDVKRPGVVVWLDELQRFIPGPYFVSDDQTKHVPVTADALRRLLSLDVPVVIIGTLWPIHASVLHSTDFDPDAGGQTPVHPQALDVLRLVTGEFTLESFSEAERREAIVLSERDSRLATAVSDLDYNVTEALAGAPQIMRRYEQGTEEHKGIIDAAVDARRVGVQAPLSAAFLRTAARGYLNTIHPDDSWFDRAMAEVTSSERAHDRATAPILPLLADDRRTVIGYTVADYLLQSVVKKRRTFRLPDVAWQALIDHITNSDDRWRLTMAAADRLLYGYSEELCKSFENDSYAAGWLADLRIRQGRVDEAVIDLRNRAGDGDTSASLVLADVLVRAGRVDEAIIELRRVVLAGDTSASYALVEVLADREEVEGQTCRPPGGSRAIGRRFGRTSCVQ